MEVQVAATAQARAQPSEVLVLPPAALGMRLAAVLAAPGTATVEAPAVRAALTALALPVVPMRVVEAALTADALLEAAVQSAAIPVAMVEAVISMPVTLPMVWVNMRVGPPAVSMVAVVSAPARHTRVVASLRGGRTANAAVAVVLAVHVKPPAAVLVPATRVAAPAPVVTADGITVSMLH
eukprot:contig_8263_g1936